MPAFDLFAFDTWKPDQPSTILGYGGWDSLSDIFADGAGNIFAVDPSTGNLLRYRITGGIGQVEGPEVIGHGGWQWLTCLSAEPGGLIYAVEKSTGNLLRYTNADVGEASGPTIIGHGGWNAFSFVFCGRGGVIYAVEAATGDLRRYRDAHSGSHIGAFDVVGHGGWANFTFLFSGPPGVIFGVDPQGVLLLYGNADTAAELASSLTVSGGWTSFLQLLASGNRLLGIRSGPVSPRQQLFARARMKRSTNVPFAGCKSDDIIILPLPPEATLLCVRLEEFDYDGDDASRSTPVGNQVGDAHCGARLVSYGVAEGTIQIRTHWWFDLNRVAEYSVSVWLDSPNSEAMQISGDSHNDMNVDHIVGHDFQKWVKWFWDTLWSSAPSQSSSEPPIEIEIEFPGVDSPPPEELAKLAPAVVTRGLKS